MGMNMNTLYVILILLAVLGIVYLSMGLHRSDKQEGFETSANVVLNLLGNDFYKLPTDEEVKNSVNKPYPKRFNNAIKYSVYALYKAASGGLLLAEKAQDAQTIITSEKNKGRNLIDGMSAEQAQSTAKEIRQECKGAMEIQPAIEQVINALADSPGALCGEPFKTAVGYDKFSQALNNLKICKQKIVNTVDAQQSLNVLKDAADFSIVLVNEVLKYLNLLNAELIILSDCPTAAESGACAASATSKEGNTNMPATNKSSPSSYQEAYSASLTSDTEQSNLPKGVPKYMIPPGQEDLYILKSEIVPPVCPACPDPVLKCDGNKDPPPPCPPCARCPEPSFECKKVPNYGTGNLGANYNNFGAGFGRMMSPDGSTPSLPYPVSDETSMFGM